MQGEMKGALTSFQAIGVQAASFFSLILFLVAADAFLHHVGYRPDTWQTVTIKNDAGAAGVLFEIGHFQKPVRHGLSPQQYLSVRWCVGPASSFRRAERAGYWLSVCRFCA